VLGSICRAVVDAGNQATCCELFRPEVKHGLRAVTSHLPPLPRMAATGRQPSFTCSLLSGAVAGPSVDIALYPLDTIKTRLQSADGFIKAGGFRGVYAGLGAGAIGSAPGSMFFFSTYEGVKKMMGPRCASC